MLLLQFSNSLNKSISLVEEGGDLKTLIYEESSQNNSLP